MNADLDFEEIQSFSFVVRATDLDTDLYKEQTFTVNVINEPNEPIVSFEVEPQYKCSKL